MKNIILRYLVLIFFLFSKNIYAQILVSDSTFKNIHYSSWDEMMNDFDINKYKGDVIIKLYDDINIRRNKYLESNFSKLKSLKIIPVDTCTQSKKIFILDQDCQINFDESLLNVVIDGSTSNLPNNNLFQFNCTLTGLYGGGNQPIIYKKGKIETFVLKNCDFIFPKIKESISLYPLEINFNSFNNDSSINNRIQILNNSFINTDSTIVISNNSESNFPIVEISNNNIRNFNRSALVLNGDYSKISIVSNRIYNDIYFYKHTNDYWSHSNALEFNITNSDILFEILRNRMGNNHRMLDDGSAFENSIIKINLLDTNSNYKFHSKLNLINNYFFLFHNLSQDFRGATSIIDINKTYENTNPYLLNFYNNTTSIALQNKETNYNSIIKTYLDENSMIYMQNNIFISNTLKSLNIRGVEYLLRYQYRQNLNIEDALLFKKNIHSNNNIFYSKNYYYLDFNEQYNYYMDSNATFASYQKFIYPEEQNSYNLPVTFKDSINPYVSGEFEGYWALAGIPLNQVKEDIDGRPRDPYYPYRGAYEGQKIIHVGIPQVQSMSNESEVFPNPFKNQINIKTHSNQTQSIQLYGIDGKLWLQEEIKGQKEINTEMLPEGMYVCVVGGKAYKMIK